MINLKCSFLKDGFVAQLVRARASHARGRRFEPCRIHQNTPLRHCRFGVFFVALFRQGERVGAALREQSVFAPLHFAYAFFGRKQTIDYRLAGRAATGASPVESTIKTHAKGAYKTPTRVSFSMQNRGELPFLWQFTLFVVSSRIAVGICSSLALGNRKPLTIVQKGFLHDKERMISSVLINEKMTDRTLTNTVGRLLIRFLL